MVHHIVCWNFNEDMTTEEKREAALMIKEKLEAIQSYVQGAISIEVIINELESSNRDIALISKFKTVEDLQAYQVHPMHVEAGTYIRTVTCNRACIDYEE